MLFIYHTDTLHICKTVIGGTVEYIQWGDSSFKMNIFADCFPKEHHVHVLISTDHYFQFEIPKGYKLLSPTYQIKANEWLQTPGSFTLKHNAVITNRSGRVIWYLVMRVKRKYYTAILPVSLFYCPIYVVL